jgi:peptide-methionine (S)-S-oxide reductase
MTLLRAFAASLLFSAGLAAANVPPPAVDLPPPSGGKVATLVLSGGSFWGVEAVFERVRGVIAVIAGYAGGKPEDAHFDLVGAGRTKHAESVQITYDPAQIAFGKLLQVFFAVVHDPTQIDRQGPDYGPQFRSVIWFSNDAQKKVAQAYITQIARSHAFRDPIMTQVAVLMGFFPAEQNQQHYVQRNPNDPYVVQNVMPRIQALEQQFPDLLKP